MPCLARLCWRSVFVCFVPRRPWTWESIKKCQSREQTSAAKSSSLQTLSKPFRMTKMEMNFPTETALQCSPHNLVWTCYRWGGGLKPVISLLEDWDAVASVCLIMWLDEPGVNLSWLVKARDWCQNGGMNQSLGTDSVCHRNMSEWHTTDNDGQYDQRYTEEERIGFLIRARL